VAFISKKENKYMPIISQIMHKLMCPLIDRENDREALKTILRCIDMLKQDKVSIGVFPEGYVSLDGRLRHFRGGVFKIAQKTGVPIVVCTIRNTKKAMRDLFAMRKTWIEMHLVDVVDAEEVKATATIDMAERVYEIMIRDLGETYRSDEKAMHPNLQTCIDPIE
jgi:1-acyl-sn-glycerol-3-phosphate acyltransferase